MAQQIVINTKNLSRSFWERTYLFFRDCMQGRHPDEGYCSSYHVQFLQQGGTNPRAKLSFWIIYQKDSYREDFTEMVPFFMITHGIEGIRATFAIDLGIVQTDIKAQDSYIFKCSEFFRFINVRDKSHRLLLLNEKVCDKDSGEIINFAPGGVTRLRRKNDSDPGSRKYLPLISISTSVFNNLFEKSVEPDPTSAEVKYIRDVLRKISEVVDYDLKNASLFDEWFIKSYFYYLKEYQETIDYDALKDVLRIYCSNIFELVQNIISHTADHTGLLYLVFNSFSDLSAEQKSKLPMLSEDGEDPSYRFISIGIIDFNQEGITGSFYRKYYQVEELELKDFYSPKQLSTGEVTHLDFRRMAHIGLPVLMSTIRNYRGCFRVESNRNSQKQVVELVRGELNTCPLIDYVDGTHYEILLPIVPGQKKESPKWSLMQKSSILNRLIYLKKKNYPRIPKINLSQYITNESLISDKKYQAEEIEKVGKKIIKDYGGYRELALDCDDSSIQPSIIVKLVSYLQMGGDDYHPIIILSSLSEDLVDLICSLIVTLLVKPGVKPIWSPNSAVILLSKGLRYQVISGSSPGDLYRINADYSNYYYSQKNYFESELSEIPELDSADDLDRFIRPYELLIGDGEDHYGLFYAYVHDLLKQPMGTNKMGYRLDPYTYIGNKLIVESFYEADSMFQNSFFTDRFAFIIAEKISACVDKSMELAIIGYKFYSEQLVKTVAKYLKGVYEVKSDVFIADEDNGGQLLIDIPQDKRKSILNKQFVTIVPIGATLSTNDKIIAELKRLMKEGVNVVYNHCSIVVRNIEGKTDISDIEREQKWWQLDLSERKVGTIFENAKEIHFDILIGTVDPNSPNWWRRFNKEVSFPDDYRKERYVNPSENASINSRNLLGIPRLDRDLTAATPEIHLEELKRLHDLKKDVYSGHIDYNGSHYRYYFDTESYVRKAPEMFLSWLDDVAVSLRSESTKLNIIITPNARIDSDLVNIVNEKVFGGNALIVFFDVNNWKSNIINKFSYVSELVEEKKGDVHFHFVDHSLFSASTYKKTKSYLRALCPDVSFSSGIVVINRLNFILRKEIKSDFKDGNLFVYFNLFVPETSDSSNCTQCDLSDYYTHLKSSTALSSCRELIERSQHKIRKRLLPDLRKEKMEQPSNPSLDRRFLRLFFAHEISFKVSSMDLGGQVEQILDPLYHELFDEKPTHKDEGLKLLNQWFDDSNYLYDKRISFLKALSSPPLSRYIILRQYAHKALLDTLSMCLEKTEDNCNYDDFRLMKAVMKSLSFFNSNAIIRKEVLLRSWDLQSWNVKKVEEELESIPTGSLVYDEYEKKLHSRYTKLKQFGKYYQFYIKNATFEDGCKSNFLGELLRTGEEICEYPMKVSETSYHVNLSSKQSGNPLFKDFISDVFYDNTTITRKTIAEFEKEIQRDNQDNLLFDCFFNREENNSLRPFSYFKDRMTKISKELTKKVRSGYYYSYFEPYLDNGDGIEFVDKFACLLFLKFKFKEIEKARQRVSIEDEILELLSGFQFIMGAKYALYAVGDEDGIYLIDTKSAKGVLVDPDSYVCRLHRELDSLPDIILNDTFPFGKEDDECSKHCVNLASSIIINKQNDYSKNQTLSFFYQGMDNEDLLSSLYVMQRESARLLLLLREEMDTFFVNFLLKERVVDLWIERNDSHNKFDKVYRSSAHVFKSVFDEMSMLESMDMKYLKSLNTIWFWLSNEIISFLYSNIERYIDKNKRHYLQLDSSGHILEDGCRLKDVFDGFFISILQSLLEERWYKKIGNKILINGIDINDRNVCVQDPEALVHCKKQVFQTFIVQCLNNSFAINSDRSRGHRRNGEVKDVNIVVSKDEIQIKDHVTDGDLTIDNKRKRKASFSFKKGRILEMSCKRYSSTTLTSIQGVTEYMRKQGYAFGFDFGFDDESRDFYIRLKFN